MSLKVKLISCIAAFVLVLSMLFVSVFAAQNINLNVGGNVSFTASSVYADITGSYVGTAEHTTTAEDLTPIHITVDTTDGAVSMPDDWTSVPLNFDSSASPITVTINIQNLASGRAISVSLTDNTNITGVNVAREYNSETFEGNTTNKTITGGGTGTFTFTLTVSNKNSDITGTFDLDLSLTSIEQGSGYTATINIVDDSYLQYSKELGVAINNSSDVTPFDAFESYTQKQIILYNVETIAITNYRNVTTRVTAQYTINLSSNAGFSGTLGSNAYDFLGWYTLTQDTTFTITISDY